MAQVGSYDIFNLDLLYETSAGGYTYSLPRKILEEYISGQAFDHKEKYTSDQSERLRADVIQIFQHMMAQNPQPQRVAVITAGAPGCGKTMKLRQIIQENTAKGVNFIYVDPDDVFLPSQTRTYVAEIESGDRSKESRQAAYTTWRPGSNAGTHLALGHAARLGMGFYFGSTSTSPLTYRFFDFLKKHEYKIILVHVTAPDNVRWESIVERDKTFMQTTEQDVREKGLLLPQRINDTYLKYADEIAFYYRDRVDGDAQLAATWDRRSREEPVSGTIHVASKAHYEALKQLHNISVQALGRPELSWENTVEKISVIE